MCLEKLLKSFYGPSDLHVFHTFCAKSRQSLGDTKRSQCSTCDIEQTGTHRLGEMMKKLGALDN